MLKRLLDLTEFDLLVTNRSTVRTDWRYRNVNSPFSRLYLITRGEGSITFHKGRRACRLRPGHLYLIPCFTSVDLYCPRSFFHYYVHFTCRLPNGTDLLSLIHCGHDAAAREHGITAGLFDRLIRLNPDRTLPDPSADKSAYRVTLSQLYDQDRRREVAEHIETSAILKLVLTAFLQSPPSATVFNTVQGIQRFEAVLDYIHENLSSAISLAQIAGLVDLNPAYFSYRFGRLMGLSPLQYINRKRIEKGQTLLLATDRPLKQIAREAGFADELYFSRLFKRYTGLSPAAYRRQGLII